MDKILKMKNKILIVSCIIMYCGLYTRTMAQEKEIDYTKYVDPFIGADGGGNVYPGPCVPNGMIKPGPDCGNMDWNAGWDPSGKIVGFSHTHVSGTGGDCKYGNILLMPTTGDINILDYSSQSENEHSEVGLYSVDLKRYNTSVKFSSAHSTTLHEYTFPATDKANVLIDLGSLLTSYTGQFFVGSELTILSDTEVEGHSRAREGWNRGTAYTVYFYAKFDRPAISYGSWKDGRIFTGIMEQSDENKKTGAYFTFNTNENQKVKVKVSISFMGKNKARYNSEEITSWDVDEVRAHAVTKWNEILSRVKVEGKNEIDKKIFYSSIYRIFLAPSNRTGENPLWQSDKPYYDDYYAIWDTYRATHPFITLISPSLQSRLVESLVDIYRYDHYMPDARSGNDNGLTQGGSNCDILIADALAKGLNGIDYKTALQAMIKNAEVPPGDNERKQGRGGLLDYNRLGYVSTDYERSCSRVLEYANNDFAISQVAEALGETEIYEKYKKKAHSWENLWKDDVESLGFNGFIWPRKSDGQWISSKEFDVFSTGSFEKPFYETFPWEYSFYVPHDMKSLIEKCGGRETFAKRLDAYFTEPFGGNRDHMQLYVTFVGMCQISNEPAFLNPSLYTYVNMPYKTAKIVRGILATQYNTSKKGLPGNDDSGSMAAWYAFHALGFYPNAGQDVYLISSPLFPKAIIELENGKQVEIIAKNASDKNIYIQSCRLNGKPFNNGWFRHGDIADGARFEFIMGNKPSKWAVNGELPPSMSDL